MLVHTVAPKIEAAPRRPVTYGSLFDATCQGVRAAVLLPQLEQLTSDSAYEEIRGYQRFLRISGTHLQLLSRFQLEVTPETRHVVSRLAEVPDHGAGPSSWLAAGQLLGAAHDLLATHLDGKLVPRTVEAEETFNASTVLPATRGLTALVVDAINAAPDLIQAAGESQKGQHFQPIPYPWLAGLRRRTNALRPFAKAVHLDVSRLAPEGESSPLSALEPAPLVTDTSTPGSAFESVIDAMRTLRELTLGQADGRVGASPMSLRDLALVGAKLTEPDLSWLPPTATSLDRLDRAHALDSLEAAHTSWVAAASDLTQVILGLTRAPQVYGDAVGAVSRSERQLPSVQLALLAALPRLGQDAAHTIDRLHSQNALVAKQRDGARLATVWRPITHSQANALAAKFDNAAITSRQAATTIRRVLARPDSGARRSSHVPTPQVRRDVELSRGASR